MNKKTRSVARKHRKRKARLRAKSKARRTTAKKS
jgi:hypothetical protein